MQILPSSVSISFKKELPCGSAGKVSARSAGDLGSIPGLGRSPGEGKGYPLQYSSLENFMDCVVPGVAKSRTWLSNFHFTSRRKLVISVQCVPAWMLWGSFVCDYGLYVACQASLSVRFPQQEYWSGLSFPSPGKLPRPRDQSGISCIDKLFATDPPGKPI